MAHPGRAGLNRRAGRVGSMAPRGDGRVSAVVSPAPRRAYPGRSGFSITGPFLQDDLT